MSYKYLPGYDKADAACMKARPFHVCPHWGAGGHCGAQVMAVDPDGRVYCHTHRPYDVVCRRLTAKERRELGEKWGQLCDARSKRMKWEQP